MSNRLLYIDDDQPLLAVAAKVLREHGFDVTAAPGNDEALAHLEREPQGFDLVIQDCQRPLGRCLADTGPPDALHGSSGLFFLRRHIWRLNPRLACLFATANPASWLCHRDPELLGNPFFHYLSKPFALAQLVIAVEDILVVP
jgi:CheY-like chemotaxis protein